MMALMSPGQIVVFDHLDSTEAAGWWLFFHPDFIRNYPLGKKIKEYGFFSYEVNEALHLSDHEEKMIADLIDNIQREYHSPIDLYSQDVMVSYLDVLLNYTNRFYNRQFITRKSASMDLLVQIDDLLTEYFNGDSVQQRRLPTVQYLSGKLNVSPNYLSDMLRKTTGQSAQKHIHNKLIEQAKDYLVTSTLTVSEIAYLMGFEHPQSFSKLFKSKTNQSPMDYRNSFH
ncbi:helix-turn-helix domain-containing protein [Paenibacillus aurantiacus]|uniref:Helix-turn-helix domain-containing protein n=1 Tax=Paenibacillus aurantiacus TaxID=1936118 RepID=A0ABV5KJZ1_9BACL